MVVDSETCTVELGMGTHGTPAEGFRALVWYTVLLVRGLLLPVKIMAIAGGIHFRIVLLPDNPSHLGTLQCTHLLSHSDLLQLTDLH